MKYCANCKKEFDDSVELCPDCGIALELKAQPQVETKVEQKIEKKSFISSIFEEKQMLWIFGIFGILAIVAVMIVFSGYLPSGMPTGKAVEVIKSTEEAKLISENITSELTDIQNTLESIQKSLE